MIHLHVLNKGICPHLLQKNMLPKYRTKSKSAVQDVLLECVPEEVLWPQAYEELFERDYTTIAQKINEYRQSIGQKKRRRRSFKRTTAKKTDKRATKKST